MKYLNIGKYSAKYSNHWKTALLILPIIGTLAQARDWSFRAPNDSIKTPYREAFYQAATLNIHVHGNSFSNADVVMFEMYSATNVQNVHLASTGTVVGATNAYFHIPPDQSNIYTGRYTGLIRWAQLNGDTPTNQDVLVSLDIAVVYSTDSRYYNLVGPLSYPLDAVTSNLMGAGFVWTGSNWIAGVNADITNTLGQITDNTNAWSTGVASWLASAAHGITAAAISNWTAAYDWGNHASAGYYKTNDTMLWTNTPIRGPGLGTAYLLTVDQNGLPKYKSLTDYLTAESDPVWTAASTNYPAKPTPDGTVWGYSNGVWVAIPTASSDGGATNIIPGYANSYNAETHTWTWSTNADYALKPAATFKPGKLLIRSAAGSLNFDNTDIRIGAYYDAYAGGGGIAIGGNAVASEGGAVVGWTASAPRYGAALGGYAKGDDYGAAIGGNSGAWGGTIGTNHGVAVGREAIGESYSVAVGAFATCTRGAGMGRVALGLGVTNAVANSIRVRGALAMWQPIRLDAHPTPETNLLWIYTLGTNGLGYAMNEGGIAAVITAHNEYGDDLRVTYDDRTGVERIVNETLRDELMLAAITDSKGWDEYQNAARAAYEKSVAWRTNQPPRNTREQAKAEDQQKEIDAWDAEWAISPSTNKPPRPEPYKPVIVPPRPVRPKQVRQ